MVAPRDGGSRPEVASLLVPLSIHWSNPSARLSASKFRAPPVWRRSEFGSRRGRDSNSRNPFGFGGFQDRCIQPLCHRARQESSPDRGTGTEKPRRNQSGWGGRERSCGPSVVVFLFEVVAGSSGSPAPASRDGIPSNAHYRQLERGRWPLPRIRTKTDGNPVAHCLEPVIPPSWIPIDCDGADRWGWAPRRHRWTKRLSPADLLSSAVLPRWAA